MNAIEAYNIATQATLQHETIGLQYAQEFDKKIEEAARNGRFAVMVGPIPIAITGFMTLYYEQRGYHIMFAQSDTPDHWNVQLIFSVLPYSSRNWLKHQEFVKFWESIPVE